MNLSINGEDKTVDADTTVSSLIEQLGLGDKRVAVEINRHVVPRADWSETKLADADQVEIVQFVGGG